MTDVSTASDRFTELLAALSRRTATSLEAPQGLLVLIDGGDNVQLVVERDDDRVMLVARVMAIPQEDPAGLLALRLLRLNADRDALSGATIAADSVRRQFVLIRELALQPDAEAMADEIDAMLDLAAEIRADVAGARVHRPPTAALLVRASGRAA